VFKDNNGIITTLFNKFSRNSIVYVLSGCFIPKRTAPWHTPTEIVEPVRQSIIAELLAELYSDDGPLRYANPAFADQGYPHTNLTHDLVETVLDIVRPKFWLELGSMLGGSAIRTAEIVKKLSLQTQIVCVDPFTGDVNMWAWERGLRGAGQWQFLRLARGKPTIYERFLANIVVAKHDNIVLPINVTSIVGIKLLHRLFSEGRITMLPEVIYLDSAHEPEETFLELKNCWNLLQPGGVLMGDDWGWSAVRDDVRKFASMVRVDQGGVQRLIRRHGKFTECNGILLDDGQWVLIK
jgi:predicted O-methyltransferase YrrM